MKRMRILIIADEVWNDEIHGNNVLSNWFNGFQAEFAEIYCSPGTPGNKCCENYFQLTDLMMVKSVFGKRAGRGFHITIQEMFGVSASNYAEQMPTRFYRFMKSIASNGIRVIRDLIWLTGRYDKKAMQDFVNDFNPDIVFCPRLLTPKLLRLERTIMGMTKAPFVAFTADDEASLRQVSYSPVYWFRRFLFRKFFNKHISNYKHYFMFSEDQAAEYFQEYGVPTSVLFKSGNFQAEHIPKQSFKPIKIVYAGRLYCNRWKTLAAIGKALQEINIEAVHMTLDIYTQEILSKSQLKEFSKFDYVQLKGRVDSSELTEIYKDADIALHVESFEKKNRYATRVSFSTKIIDLMASTCAIMAICWEKHAGYQYLKKHDAAICVSDLEDIKPQLERIVENPELIKIYAMKAWNCGKKNHNRDLIQGVIHDTFSRVMDQK